MRTLLVPALVVGVLPGLYLAHRLGLLRHRGARLTIGLLVLGTVLASLPYEGLDLADLKLLNLLLVGIMTVLMVLRQLDNGRALTRSGYAITLLAIAALALLGQLNFFAFHGNRTYVHLHDVAHYYLGAKYFEEVGYTDLYTAMLRAEAETWDNHFVAVEARDLRTNEVVHIRELLRASDPVKAAFQPRRWDAFKADVAIFRDRLGPQYGDVLTDHGFNPSPAWIVIGGTLAGRVPAGSYLGVVLLTLIDPLLLLATLVAVWWAFGREPVLLATIHLCVIFGAGFAWTGGAFLRAPWFAATVIGLCCVRRSRWVGAGALLALAATLRLFPVVFALGLVLRGVREAVAQRRLPPRHLTFVASFAATGALMVVLTGFVPHGLASWPDFASRMRIQVANISPNLIGLTQVLAHHTGPSEVTREELSNLEERRQRLYRWQLATVLPAALVLSLFAAARVDDLNAALLGVPLLLVGFNLAGYYYVLLVLLVLAHHAVPRNLALIFGVELASYVLLLFADREATVYVLRTVLLLYLVTALYWDPAIGAINRSIGRTHCSPNGES